MRFSNKSKIILIVAIAFCAVAAVTGIYTWNVFRSKQIVYIKTMGTLSPGEIERHGFKLEESANVEIVIKSKVFLPENITSSVGLGIRVIDLEDLDKIPYHKPFQKDERFSYEPFYRYGRFAMDGEDNYIVRHTLPKGNYILVVYNKFSPYVLYYNVSVVINPDSP